MRIHVYTQFYRPKDERRWAEVRSCLEKNLENAEIDVLHVLYEKEEDLQYVPGDPKLILSPLTERLSYGAWLDMTQRLDVGDISLLINSDIYLDETLKVLRDDHEALLKHNVFIALTRYNPVGPLLLLNKNPHWTQDVWGVTVPEKPFHTALLQETAFNLGQPGCDNKIAFVMHSYGFRVTNPCRQLRSVHLHEEKGRRYDARADKLIGMHAFVYPSDSPHSAAKLEFDLLSRAETDVTHLQINNFINQRTSFRLVKEDELPLVKGAPMAVADLPTPPEAIAPANSERREIKRNVYGVTNAKTPSELSEHSDVVILKRHDVENNGLMLIEEYSPFLSLYEDANHFYFHDKGWPNAVRILKRSVSKDFLELRPVERFIHGFGRHKLNLTPYEIFDCPRYDGHIFYWQQPARTEQDAWDRLADVSGENFERGVCNIAVGLPWATFIDLRRFPEALICLLGARIGRIRRYLDTQGIKLRVHTVCQHIFWRQFLADFAKAGITDLWIAHKLQGESRLEGMRLHAWPLYPVNIFDKDRAVGMVYKPILERGTFASFTGAYMPHYISDVRKRLLALASLPGYKISLKDAWHFNNAVYQDQLNFRPTTQTTGEMLGARKYNSLLSDSRFSLCPSGAGPNSIRLWEALGAGSIPVVLADSYELPKLTRVSRKAPVRWKEAVIIHAENDLDGLDRRLRAIKPAELQDMQQAGRMIHESIWAKNIVLE